MSPLRNMTRAAAEIPCACFCQFNRGFKPPRTHMSERLALARSKVRYSITIGDGPDLPIDC